MKHLVITAAIVWAGCGTARRSAPVVAGEAITDPQVKRGELAFFRNCHPCHPGGEEGLGPALNNKPLSLAIIATQVRSGLGAMPAFPTNEISDKTLREIAEYMKWLRDLEPTREASDTKSGR